MLGLLVAGSGMCASLLLAVEPHVSIPAYKTLTDQEEIELGRSYGKFYEGDHEVIHHALIDRYLNRLVSELAKVSQRPNLSYDVKLINTHDVNADSLCGGFLYVYRGLIEPIETEGELAATLGHEIGHIVGRHYVNQRLLQFQTKSVLGAIRENLGKNNKMIEQIISELGGTASVLALLHFSRQDELEADMLGFCEFSSNYNPVL